MCHVNRGTKAGVNYANHLRISTYARREKKHEKKNLNDETDLNRIFNNNKKYRLLSW